MDPLIEAHTGEGFPDMSGYHMLTHLEHPFSGDLLLVFHKASLGPTRLTRLRVTLVEARAVVTDVTIEDYYKIIGGFTLPPTTRTRVNGDLSQKDEEKHFTVEFVEGSITFAFRDAFHMWTTHELPQRRVIGGGYLVGPRAIEAELDYSGCRLERYSITDGRTVELDFFNPQRDASQGRGRTKCVFTYPARAVFSKFRPYSMVEKTAVNVGGGKMPSYRFCFSDDSFVEVEAKRVSEVNW
jgi:hypothetical protein